MCLITKQRESLIAEEDIVVYKVFTLEDKSPYQEFDYTPYIGKLFTDSADEKCIEFSDFCGNFVNLSVHGGFIHSFTNLRTAKIEKDFLSDNLDKECFIIRRCLIPKGTKYYCSDNEVASKSIIIGNKIIY